MHVYMPVSRRGCVVVMARVNLIIFQFMQVDVAVLEVGLGGKFDATNVVRDLMLQQFHQLMQCDVDFIS